MDSLFLPLLLTALVAAMLLALSLARAASRSASRAAARADASRLATLSAAKLADVVAAVFEERGYGTINEVVTGDAADLLLEKPDPQTPQRWLVRCVRPKEGGAVESVEVRFAAERAREEKLDKAAVVTTGGFSPSARLAAAEASVLLVDGHALGRLVSMNPGLAERYGLGAFEPEPRA